MRMSTLSPIAGYRPQLGFDDALSLMERAMSAADVGWPAYNLITVGDDHYRIVLALPGFKEADLEIVCEPNRLTVSGRPQVEPGQGEVVYRGIVAQPFKRSFQLADHVRVDKARLADGLLDIELVREIPEALKPKQIRINRSDQLAVEQAGNRREDDTDAEAAH